MGGVHAASRLERYGLRPGALEFEGDRRLVALRDGGRQADEHDVGAAGGERRFLPGGKGEAALDRRHAGDAVVAHGGHVQFDRLRAVETRGHQPVRPITAIAERHEAGADAAFRRRADPGV